MIKNEVECGHIVFTTAADPNEPDVVGAPYNMSVRRQVVDDVTVPGQFVVTCGKCMAPPADDDADLSCTSSPIPVTLLWNDWNVSDLGVNANGDREYLLAGTEEVAGGLSIRVCDTAGIVIRFDAKRVNPRAT